jgi:hypothetical protein
MQNSREGKDSPKGAASKKEKETLLGKSTGTHTGTLQKNKI